MPQDDTSNEPSWQFNDKGSAKVISQDDIQAPDSDNISWTASEFVANQKNVGWYLLIILTVAILAAGVYFLTQDIVSSVMVGLAGVGLAIFGARKPRVLSYELEPRGLKIGNKGYSWHMFKSFSVIEEGAINSIYLTPLQRFMPAINIYYDPNEEQKIVDYMSDFLPYEERQRDFVDKLMHKIRF